jgi:3-oxoacyl-[acyl-carrier-protein] synthase III
MKIWISALALLALSACEKPEELLENSIRSELSKQGEVREVDMRADGDDRLSGFAVVKGPQGDSRLNCKATKKSSTEYDWECNQVVDEAALKGMEDSLRQSLEAQQLTVMEIDLQKAGEDNMKGHAMVRDDEGAQGRLTCTAARAGTTFQGECHVPAGGAG